MKRKVGTRIDEEVLILAKQKALEEDRSLSDVIQDAIMAYFNDGIPSPQEREMAYQLFCERPIRITRQQLQEIIKDDHGIYEPGHYFKRRPLRHRDPAYKSPWWAFTQGDRSSRFNELTRTVQRKGPLPGPRCEHHFPSTLQLLHFLK